MSSISFYSPEAIFSELFYSSFCAIDRNDTNQVVCLGLNSDGDLISGFGNITGTTINWNSNTFVVCPSSSKPSSYVQVSLNNNGLMAAVFVIGSEAYCAIGQLTDEQMVWQTPVKYASQVMTPVVGLTDDGLLLSVYNYISNSGLLLYRTGYVSGTQGKWNSSYELSSTEGMDVNSLAYGNDGSIVIMYQQSKELSYIKAYVNEDDHTKLVVDHAESWEKESSGSVSSANSLILGAYVDDEQSIYCCVGDYSIQKDGFAKIDWDVSELVFERER